MGVISNIICITNYPHNFNTQDYCLSALKTASLSVSLI